MTSGGFSSEAFLAALGELDRSTERQVVYHEICDSTSTDLKRRLDDGAAPGTAVVAGSQTEGRGRQGRSWHSPSGNLYISIALELSGRAVDLVHLVPLAAGVAAVEVAKMAGAEEAVLKWPNDVMVEDRKLAGILCEAPNPRTRPLVVLAGLGMNVSSIDFPPEMGRPVTSLVLEAGVEESLSVGIEVLAAEWVAGLERWIETLEQGRSDLLIGRWIECAEKFGRRVEVDGKEGVSVGLNDQGRLLVRLDHGDTIEVAGGTVERIE